MTTLSLAPAPEAPAQLRLGAILDLKAAGVLHRDVLAMRGRNAKVDASEVVRLGGQCLQVLLAALCAWKADGLSFSIVNPSPSFLQTLDLFGFVHDGGIHKDHRS
jgi:chemotaxis protein CheX